MTVGYLPKDIVNQYFAAAKTGVRTTYIPVMNPETLAAV